MRKLQSILIFGMPRIIEIFHIGIIATVHLPRVDACQYQYWFFFVKNSGFLPFLKTMPILILGCLAKVTKFQFYKTDEYQYWVVYEYCVFFCFFFCTNIDIGYWTCRLELNAPCKPKYHSCYSFWTIENPYWNMWKMS